MIKNHSLRNNSTGKLTYPHRRFKNERTAADSSQRAFRECRSGYRTQVIVRARLYFIIRECPVRDVNHILRGGGGCLWKRHQVPVEQPCGKYYFLLV